ncbi:MAG TPA: M15 family metallopeptidase [Micromonosporaceae bacterium]
MHQGVVTLLVVAGAAVGVNVVTASPALADGCYTWTREMIQGMSGEDVRQLQIRVAGWPGSYGEVLSVDGTFGARTKAAVQRFQAAYGLTADGRAGPATQAKLYELQDDDCSPIHFSFAEVTDSDDCGSQASLTGGSVPASQVRENLIRVMWQAEALRHQLGDRPMTVTSGFRSKYCDDLVNGRDPGEGPYGQHTYGQALDFGGTPTLCEIAQQARYAGFNGILGPGYPDHNDHTHLDIRSSRFWSAPNCGVS